MLAAAHSLSELTLLAQDGEGSGRGFWFIALVIILAIQHISEKFKEKRAAQELQRQHGHDDEDEWHNQVETEPEGYHDPNPPNENLLEFFRSVAQAQSGPAVEVEVPPPPPPEPEPERRRGSQLSLAERRALEDLKQGKSHLTHGRTHRQRIHASAEHSELGKMLRNPASLRNAFILKEVLEPPLAARDHQEPHQV